MSCRDIPFAAGVRGGYGSPTLRAMHSIHKCVAKGAPHLLAVLRNEPHHGISKDSDLCASAHRCPHYAYARLIARVNSQFISGAYSPEPLPRIP